MKLPKLKSFSLPRFPRGRIARGVATALFFAAVALAPTLLTSPDRLAPAIEGAFGSALEGPLDRSPDPSAKAAAEAAARRANPAAAGGPFAIAQADADRATWSWTEAKKLAAEVWEAQIPGPGVYSSFYCGCTVERRGATGGDVDTASCGYEMRSSALRASRLEWEHVVPAAAIGAGRQCWTQGAAQCIDPAGRPFRGRSCCEIADPVYNIAATDPVNLVPAIGEVNADRSNFAFAQFSGRLRAATSGQYGQCQMRVDFDGRRVEPPANRRGDIARIAAYMSQAYGIAVTAEQAAIYQRWMAEDPVSAEEVAINRAIAARGHRPNPFVLPRE